jgi:hypothetical protein
MRMSPRKWKIGIGSLCVVGVAVAIGSIACSRAPFGHFDSTTLMGLHDSADVLTFSNGVVLWETCCGGKEVGSFTHLPDGRWTWQFASGSKKKPSTNEFVLQPGLFTLRCYETSTPTNIYSLRRRLFAPKEAE